MTHIRGRFRNVDNRLDAQAETLCRVLGAPDVVNASRVARENPWVMQIPALRGLDVDLIEATRRDYRPPHDMACVIPGLMMASHGLD